MKMNLEETVQYLLDCVETGIKIEEFFTDSLQLILKAERENIGKYYLLKEGNNPIHLYTVTLQNDRVALKNLGEWPKPGAQGVPGPQGPAPDIRISPAGTWVINGIDTGKPSRGIKGETGNTGMQGRPGSGAGAMTAIDGTDYDITVSEGEDYDLITTITEIHYYDEDEEKTEAVAFKYYVPHKESIAAYFEVVDNQLQPTMDMKIPADKNLYVNGFSQVKDVNDNSLVDTFIDKPNGIVCSRGTYTSMNSVVPIISRTYGEEAYVSNTVSVSAGVEGNTLVKRLSNGQVTVPVTPLNGNQAASKQYVDEAVAGGGGGPSGPYLKDATVTGNTLDITKSTGDHVTYTGGGLTGPYLKSATVTGNTLDITTSTGEHVTYTGGGGGGGGEGKIYKHQLIYLVNPEATLNPAGDVQINIYVPNRPTPIANGTQQEISTLLEEGIAAPMITFSTQSDLEITYNQYITLIANNQVVNVNTGHYDYTPQIYALVNGGTSVANMRKQIDIFDSTKYAFFQDLVETIELN